MRITDHWQAVMLQIKANWDSYGAKPPTREAIHKAGEILKLIEIAPTNKGGIQIEFHRTGLEVGIEILPDGSVGI